VACTVLHCTAHRALVSALVYTYDVTCRQHLPDDPVRLLSRTALANQFTDVDFTYPSERQKQVLYGLSFVVEPRTKVAFVGKAGCGKSTSVTLMQRFYNASKGCVLYTTPTVLCCVPLKVQPESSSVEGWVALHTALSLWMGYR
jgi:ABC-type transport system involved in cytochrome bd biosynthesis fused ATPase/permease subunit